MRENVYKLYDEGLNSKVKLALYRTFSKENNYLHGVCDAGSIGSYLSLGLGHLG